MPRIGHRRQANAGNAGSVDQANEVETVPDLKVGDGVSPRNTVGGVARIKHKGVCTGSTRQSVVTSTAHNGVVACAT